MSIMKDMHIEEMNNRYCYDRVMDELLNKMGCPTCRMSNWNISKAFLHDELFGKGKICMRNEICEKCEEFIKEIEEEIEIMNIELSLNRPKHLE